MERSRIRIFNRSGVWIEELEASTVRSWILNDYGECTFSISVLDPKLKLSSIEFGNIVLITNKDSIPWVGVIDTPRSWTKYGVKVSAYQAEFMLSFRSDQIVDVNSNSMHPATTLTGKAGALFSQIIARANNEEDTLIRAGDISVDGVDRQEALTTDYLTHIRNIAERSSNDFEITPAFTGGNKLILKANWYAKKGNQLDLILQEGLNIELTDETMTEQGSIFNSVVALGDGTEIERFAAISRNADSISRYGLRQGFTSYISVTQFATLQDNVNSYVSQKSDAQAMLKVSCIDPNIFRYIKLGDTVRLILTSAGFRPDGSIGTDKYFRIMALKAIDDRGVMEVLLETLSTGS